jgi:hypothetical protein
MVKRLAMLLLLASPLMAQTVQHASSTSLASSTKATLPAAQNAGDTLIVGVYPPGGAVADLAGDTFTQDCTANGMAVFSAKNIAAGAATVTYKIPTATYIGIFVNEQKGQWAFFQCGQGSGTAPGGVLPIVPNGDLIYAMLSSSSCCIGTTLAAGMSILDGQADTWYGPNTFSGWAIDAVGIPTAAGPLFTYNSGQGSGTGNAIGASYQAGAPPPPLQSVNFTFSGTLTWSDPGQPDDGSPIAGSVQVSEYNPPSNAVWNTLGTATPDASGNISGTVSLSTNFADFPTIQFVLLNAAGVQQGIVQQGAPGAMFGSQAAGVVTQTIHGITGFKLIISKPSCAVTCQIAPGTVWGTLN